MMICDAASKVAITIIFLSSCSTVPQGPAGHCRPFLEALEAQAAEATAKASVAAGKPYILGVNGFTLTFPGADYELARRIGYRVIQGTSDAFEDQSCRHYQRAAEKYAKRFNQIVLGLLHASRS
jgi:hypothetical protein